MPLDPRVEAALALLPAQPAEGLTPAERRARAHAQAPQAPALREPIGALWREHDELVAGPHGDVPIRVYQVGPEPRPGLIYIHGGGWWLGTLDQSDQLCRRRATTVDCTVVAIDYRLAPEHPFPEPLDDCWAATRYVFDHADELGIDPTRIAIEGGSAGANLAAAVTLMARDTGDVRFVAQLLEVPATDLTMEAGRASAEEFAEGYFLSRADLIECAGFYLSGHDPSDPLASPLLADLHGLPPALVMTAEYDPVRDDGEAYAAKLARCDVPVTLHRWEGMVHGSAETDLLVPEIAKAYTAEVTEFLRTAFGTAAAGL